MGSSLESGIASIDPTRVVLLGDRACLAHFSSEQSAAGWAAAVRGQHWPGLTDVVLAYQSVAVFADPDEADLGALETGLRALASPGASGRSGRLHLIPVLYDGADLVDAAARLGLSADALVALHASVAYDVFAIGFLPGFPYAGYLPDALAGLARRDSPRLRVTAGSVAITGRQTAIYPTES